MKERRGQNASNCSKAGKTRATKKKTGTSLFRYKTALRQHFCALPPAPPRSVTSATPQRCCRAWPGGWRSGRCGGVRGGHPPAGGRGGRGGAGQHRVAPAGAQVGPRRARQGSGITPLMGRPSRAALAQPSSPQGAGAGADFLRELGSDYFRK